MSGAWRGCAYLARTSTEAACAAQADLAKSGSVPVAMVGWKLNFSLQLRLFGDLLRPAVAQWRKYDRRGFLVQMVWFLAVFLCENVAVPVRTYRDFAPYWQNGAIARPPR